MKRNLNKVIASVVFCMLFLAPAIWGQVDTATVQGSVKDRSGALVVGATLSAHNLDTNQTKTTTSEKDGNFRFESLPVGNYEIRTEAPGFKTAVNAGIVLTVAERAVIDVAMDVGSVAEEVQVSTDAVQQINTTNSELGATVDEQQVKDLPLNGRNYVQLALLQSGITEQKNRVADASANLASQGTYYSSNGAPIRSNRYLLDGTNMAAYGFATASSISGTTLGIDGIREFKILSGSFDAQYGMAVGSQMLIVTKSGTNHYHGSAFLFIRNSALDARNYFDTNATSGKTAAGVQRRLPAFRRGNFGASLGAPIQKDKTFFFGTYEGIRELQGTTNSANTIPNSCRPDSSGIVRLATCPLLQTAPVPQRHDTTPIAVVAPFIPLFPLTNNAADTQTTFGYGEQIREDYGQMRLDHTFSQKDNMFVRMTLDQSDAGLPSAFPGYPVFPDSFGMWDTIGESHTFSSSIVNSASVGYAFSDLHLGSPDYVTGPNFTFLPSAQNQKMGSVSITGVTSGLSAGGLYTSEGRQAVYSLTDDLVILRGKQTFKIGTLMNYFKVTAINGTSTTGGLTFQSYPNFLVGVAQSITYIAPPYNDRRDVTFNTYGVYFQDDYKVHPRLTLNMGFRYEPNTDMSEIHGQTATLRDPVNDANTTTGSLMMQNPSLKNLSPRFGAAWDVFGRGRTSIRGGVSLMQNVAVWIGQLHLAIKTPPQEVAITQTNPAALPGTTANFTVPFTVPSTSQLFAPCTPQSVVAVTTPATAAANACSRTATYFHFNSIGQQPYLIGYNLSIQQQLPFNMAVTVAYAGSRGHNLATFTEGNPVVAAGIPGTNGSGNQTCVTNPSATTPVNIANQTYTDGKNPTACWLGTVTDGVTQQSSLAEHRRNLYWGSLTELQASAQSWYNSFQTTVEKKLSHGFQYQAAFTWSRIFDTTSTQSASDGGGATSTNQLDPLHPSRDRSPATFDVPITLRVNALYSVPNLHSNKFVQLFTNGWRISPIYQGQSGSNFTVTLGNSRSRSYQGGNGGGLDRPDLVAGRSKESITHGTSTGCQGFLAGTPLHNTTHYYDPCAFSIQPAGFYGNAGRDFLRGNAYHTFDLSFTKMTAAHFLGEQGAFEFRAEIFNLLNHSNFATPNGGVFTPALTAPAFNDVENPQGTSGQIVRTLSTSRQIQLALKVNF